MNQYYLDRVKQEAKRRKKAGLVKSHTDALNQIAVERGFPNYTALKDSVERGETGAGDYQLRIESLVTGEEEAVDMFQSAVLRHHGLDEAEWQRESVDVRAVMVKDLALWIKRKRGDFSEYSVKIIAGLPGHEEPGAAGAQSTIEQAVESSPADFLVRLESRVSSQVETVEVHLAEVLEYHGLSADEWDRAQANEREGFVEDFVIWTKRRSGDFAEYFVDLISGVEPGGEASAPDSPR
jgi:hypothetical protein